MIENESNTIKIIDKYIEQDYRDKQNYSGWVDVNKHIRIALCRLRDEIEYVLNNQSNNKDCKHTKCPNNKYCQYRGE